MCARCAVLPPVCDTTACVCRRYYRLCVRYYRLYVIAPCICTGLWPTVNTSCSFLTWYQMLRSPSLLSRTQQLRAPPPSPATFSLVAGHLLPGPPPPRQPPA